MNAFSGDYLLARSENRFVQPMLQISMHLSIDLYSETTDSCAHRCMQNSVLQADSEETTGSRLADLQHCLKAYAAGPSETGVDESQVPAHVDADAE